MGSSLIGYTVIGPKQVEVNPTVIEAAKDFLSTLEALKIEVENGLDEEVASERIGGYNFDYVVDALDDVEPESFVPEFVAFWNQPESRDTNYRYYKDNKIVFAGDNSWGDEPDGYGYTMLKRADLLGILPLFEIE